MSAAIYPFLVPITAIICTFLYLMRRLQVRSAGAERAGQHRLALEELEARLAARDAVIDRLEERVRVLERIVTDGSAELREKIDRLRA